MFLRNVLLFFSSASSYQHDGSKWGKSGYFAVGREREVSVFLSLTLITREWDILFIFLGEKP